MDVVGLYTDCSTLITLTLRSAVFLRLGSVIGVAACDTLDGTG